VENSGHYLAEENPEGFVRQVLNFINAWPFPFDGFGDQSGRTPGRRREIEIGYLFLLFFEEFIAILTFVNWPLPYKNEFRGQLMLVFLGFVNTSWLFPGFKPMSYLYHGPYCYPFDKVKWLRMNNVNGVSTQVSIHMAAR
jgi:hypothetical protein